MLGVQRKLIKIRRMDRMQRERALRNLAVEYGCTLTSLSDTDAKHDEAELIRRIQEADRSLREARLWAVALISAAASAISAAAAWWAVAHV